MNFEYIDTIPDFPDNLIQNVHRAIETPSVWIRPTSLFYTVHEVDDEIKSWVGDNFGKGFETRVQTIMHSLDPHIDNNRDFCYNYIISTGGYRAETRFHNEDMSIRETWNIEKRRWHRLNVSIFHSVANVSDRRISVTVFRNKDNGEKYNG